jgi:hypothetical protein
LIPALIFICVIKCSILKNSSINISNILAVLVLYIFSYLSEAMFLKLEDNLGSDVNDPAWTRL